MRLSDPSAASRAAAFAPGLPVQLSTAQLVIAREHGCASWPELKRLVGRIAAGGVRYDTIGEGYADYRRPDRRIRARILEALGSGGTVVNVGAGAGSYEPVDGPVVAIEPSTAMALQRPEHLVPAVLGVAESLPLGDKVANAGMGILTIHHWSDPERGIAELRRVARNRVVLLTVDPTVEAEMWLFTHYVPEIAGRDREEFPTLKRITRWLGSSVSVQPVVVPSDCTDGFLLSFWSRPEAVLNPRARRATSGFARLDPIVEQAAMARLADDLKSGAWDAAHGHLRRERQLDVGLRLVVAEL
jgi:SAM-dependent methyltransferase